MDRARALNPNNWSLEAVFDKLKGTRISLLQTLTALLQCLTSDAQRHPFACMVGQRPGSLTPVLMYDSTGAKRRSPHVVRLSLRSRQASGQNGSEEIFPHHMATLSRTRRFCNDTVSPRTDGRHRLSVRFRTNRLVIPFAPPWRRDEIDVARSPIWCYQSH